MGKIAIRLERYAYPMAAAAVAILLCAVFRAQAQMLLRILLGGGILALLTEPLCAKLTRWLPPTLSALAAVTGLIVFLLAVVGSMFPVMISQGKELAERWHFGEQTSLLLKDSRIPRIDLKQIDWSSVASAAGSVLGNAAALAGSIAGTVGEFVMAVLTGFYMLRDREALSLRLEWVIPEKWRSTGLRIASAIRRELGAYLRGQITISLCVAALTAVGLWIVGVPGFLIWGVLVGLFNVIPYFGPFIGGIAPVLSALGESFGCAVETLAVLFAVQQIDSYLLGPRFMSAATGLHPAVVLLGIAVSGSLFGVAGMLLAVPFMLSICVITRIWSLRNESV